MTKHFLRTILKVTKSRVACFVVIIIMPLILTAGAAAQSSLYEIGVYYFPGWKSNSDYWNDLRGLPGSRSSGIPWPDREPLLGFNYPEEEPWIAEKHIEWAAKYGISYFVYDWYWDGKQPLLEHALKAYLKANNNNLMKFSIFWANAYDVPRSQAEFEQMVEYWIKNYFSHKQFLKIDGKPVVFIFSPEQLKYKLLNFGKSTKELFELARFKAIKAGLKGIYFVACNQPLDTYVPNSGYDAISGYNYHRGFGAKYDAKTYDELTSGYKQIWSRILQNTSLPYYIPVTSGWSRKPWGSNTPHDECVSSPETFRKHLLEAKTMLDQYPKKTKQTVVICCWNEFGEGSYIEPTKKWQFQYLQMIKDVFGK